MKANPEKSAAKQAQRRAEREARKEARKRQRDQDRAIIPKGVTKSLNGITHRNLARAAHQAGVTELIPAETIRAWDENPADAPQWFVELLASVAARMAQRRAQQDRDAFDAGIRHLTAKDKAEQQLRSGNPQFKQNSLEEKYAYDIAIIAMKELVRAVGDIDWLLDIEQAALRWVGVDPNDQTTWFITSGYPDEPS